MVRLVGFLIALFTATAAAQTVAPEDARLETIVTPMASEPFEQEMILITIRGVYGVPITLQKLEQPALDGFGWMQLGRDHWRDEMIGGRKLRVMERRMALFAKARGPAEIGPFIHHLTLLDAKGRRFEHAVASAPVRVAIARKPQGEGWWLPAQAIEVSDTWSSPPDSLAFGAAAQRAITIRAKGAAPGRLPPAPVMQGKGLIAFPDPEERAVELTPEGPVSTVTWRWTVRMLSPDTAPLETAPLHWFDTVARAPKKIVIASQRVSLPGTAAPPPAAAAPRRPAAALPLGLAGGLALGLAIILPGWRPRPWSDVRAAAARWRTRRAIRRAATPFALWRASRGLVSPARDAIFAPGPAPEPKTLARQILAEAGLRYRGLPRRRRRRGR